MALMSVMSSANQPCTVSITREVAADQRAGGRDYASNSEPRGRHSGGRNGLRKDAREKLDGSGPCAMVRRLARRCDGWNFTNSL